MNNVVSHGPVETNHRLILSSRVNGTPVFDKGGDRIGHVDDLSIERGTGRVVYAIMSFGGFLGIGEKFHPLPWSMLDFDPDLDGYVVPMDRAALESAPNYGREELVELGGASLRQYDQRIFEYYGPYGPMPYW